MCLTCFSLCVWLARVDVIILLRQGTCNLTGDPVFIRERPRVRVGNNGRDTPDMMMMTVLLEL